MEIRPFELADYDNLAAREFYVAVGYAEDPVASYGKRLIPDD